jgi:hypothetical protein
MPKSSKASKNTLAWHISSQELHPWLISCFARFAFRTDMKWANHGGIVGVACAATSATQYALGALWGALTARAEAGGDRFALSASDLV